MPNVPVYSAPTVAPQNVPDARQSTPFRLMQAAQIGPQEQMKTGQALTAAGVKGLEMATQDQIHQNEAKAKEFDAGLMGSIQGVLYGTPDDPASGYVNKKGGNAVGDTLDKTVQKLQSLAATHSEGMSTAQQEMVKTTAQMRVQSAIQAAIQHRDQQAYIYLQSAGQTRAKVASDGAAPAFNPMTDTPTLNFDQDKPESNSQYQQYLQTVASETKTLLANAGVIDKDVVDANVKQALSQAYVGTLFYLLGGKKGKAADPGSLAMAQQYFAKIQDQLSPEQVDHIKPVLDASSQQDNIVTVKRALENAPGGIAAKRKALGDAFDSKGEIGGVRVNGAIYEHAMVALDRLQSQQESNADKGMASVVGQAQDFLIRNPGASVTDLPRNIYVALQAKGHLAAIDSFASRESNKPTDPVISHNLYTHFGDGSDLDIGKLSDTDWINMKGSMSRKDWLDWDQQRTDLKQGIVAPGKDPGNLHVQGFNAALNSRMISIGVNPTKAKSTEDKERIGAIQQYASQYVISEQQAAGKRFNQQETQQALDKLFATNIGFRTEYLGGLYKGGSTSQRMMGMTVKDLPAGAYDGLKQDLIRSGNSAPTDRDILTQYWSLHGKH
jgi:hypothetical protein